MVAIRQVGTSSHDIVAALQSCIDVLQGRPASTPIDLRSREEALRLLAHLVGDLHQPLHVDPNTRGMSLYGGPGSR